MSTEFLDKTGLSYFWSRLKAWCNSLFVHLTGNETITGRKVFIDSDTQLKSSEIERTVDISGNSKYLGLSLRDKNSDLLGFFQYMRRDSGAADVKIGCLNPANTDITDHRSIYVGYDKNGIPFANAPSTSTLRSNGSDIVTRDFIPNDSRILHTSGNETATGTKTFNATTIYLKSPVIDKSVTPTDSNQGLRLFLTDKNNHSLGILEYVTRTNGVMDIKLGCHKHSSDVDFNGLYIINNANDDSYIQFNDSAHVIASNIQRTVPATGSDKFTDLVFYDSNANVLGACQYARRTNGKADIKLSCYDPATTTITVNDLASLGVGYDENGIQFASAPSTSASRNSGQDIVTRDWIPNDTRIIHATGDESLAGRKAFQQDVYHVQSAMKKGTIPNSNIWNSIIFADYGGGDATYAGNFLSFIQHGYLSDGTSTLRLCTIKNAVNSTSGSTVEVVYWSNDTGTFRPISNNFLILGSSGYRWKEIWCNQSSINSSSDERLKDDIVSVPDIVLDAWEEVDFKQFRFKDAVQEKEEKARVHSGLVAQHINNIFKKYGLDASKYGFFLYDEWDAEPEERGEDGSVVREAVPAGNSYGLRYVECLCIEAAFQRRENARLKKRVADLEERLAALELKVS